MEQYSHDRPRHLMQDYGDLRDRKALLLHGAPSWPSGRIVPARLTVQVDRFSRGPSKLDEDSI